MAYMGLGCVGYGVAGGALGVVVASWMVVVDARGSGGGGRSGGKKE